MVESVSLGEFDDRVLPIMDSGIPTCCIPMVSFPSKSIVLWKLFGPVENMMVSRARWVRALDLIKAIYSPALLVTVIDTVHCVVATARIGQWPRVISRK
jgi:hypothetical protein